MVISFIRHPRSRSAGFACGPHGGKVTASTAPVSGHSSPNFAAGSASARRQHGAVAVIYAIMLLPLVGICGLAIDVGLVYNRSVEMRNLSDSIALSAARKLNGSPSGITAALTAAESIASSYKYRNDSATISWTSAAIKFSTSPDRNGDWMDASAAMASAARIYYVKVDTSAFDEASVLRPVLMPVVSSTFKQVMITQDAIAGRTGVEIAPLAICAMSSTPAAARANSGGNVELVEYGFRRGVSYDLMKLNPLGTGSGLSYVINPVATPGTPGSAADLTAAAVAPYACGGSLAIPRVNGDTVSVASPFPLSSLYTRLNTRFDKYPDTTCSANGAPPDYNIKNFDYTLFPGTFTWLTTKPTGQTAASTTVGGKLQTVADLSPAYLATAGLSPGDFGPLWIYAKAAKYSSYQAGVLEPANGYQTFTPAEWPSLYGNQTVNKYPAPGPATGTPYKPGSGNNLALPAAGHQPGQRDRRVLNVPLLSCAAAPSGTATVQAIGRFFMTKEATQTVLAAEFAGILPFERVEGSVGMFP